MFRIATERRRRLPHAVLLVLATIGAFVAVPLQAEAAHAGVVTVTVTRVVNVGDEGIEDNLRGEADMYAGVTINGETFNSKNVHVDDDDSIEPLWVFTKPIPSGGPDSVGISIEIWDHDDCDAPFCSFSPDPAGGSDDRGDVSPIAGDAVDFVVDRTTGAWSGETSAPCSQGTGDAAVRVCWDVSIDSASGDADNDGLLDGWERNGVDADFDGVIDLNLPGFGANALHKDLFLEFDWITGHAPTRGEVQRFKDAFAAAPVNAGGTANPDGLPGINLHVDTGGLMEGGVLVGDNLGGGNDVGDPTLDRLDSSYYDVKLANFDVGIRRWIFRYGISGDPADSEGGGWGEVGGNDFIEFNHDAGTYMHEFGHNLNLEHGGFETRNCKPNYVSVMNYDLQFGIPIAGGGGIVDYSPPRFAGGRGIAPLPDLNEGSLQEAAVLDATDATNRTVFTDGMGNKVQAPLNAGIDYNADGDTTDSGIGVNIDTNATGGGPEDCTNSGMSNMKGHDDWTAISLKFRQFGDSDDGPIRPETRQHPDTQDRADMEEEINTTDLSVTLTDSADPAIAGTDLVYTVAVENQGPNPSTQTVVTQALPAGLTHVSNTGGCTLAASTLTCALGEMLARTSRTWTVTATIAEDLVYNNGSPLTVSSTATADNLAGPDPDASDDSATQETLVKAQADLAITSFMVESPPSEIIIGETQMVTTSTDITSGGPSSPMDAAMAGTASAEPGATITPVSTSSVEVALTNGEQRTLDESFTISCEAPGSHTYSFTRSISPDRPDDIDPDLADNSAAASFTVDCIVPIALNIKPGSMTNPVNLGSNGVIPAAALTTAAGEYGLPLAFDATRIQVATVRFGQEALVSSGGGAPETHGKAHLEDVVERTDELTKDGDLDQMMHFRTQMTGLTVSDTEACAKGKFTGADGNTYTFFGCDVIIIVP
ncbi:MAG TPA: DUF11 domain-containing protein [Actinomycetota bacterium]